jgi:hypothetical protein
MLLYFGTIITKWPPDRVQLGTATSTSWGHTHYVIKPQSELKLRLRSFWFPIHEVSAADDMNHFLGYSWRSEGTALQFSQVEGVATSIKPAEAMTLEEILKHTNYTEHDIFSTDYLIVAPRWNKDLEILREWYLELPGFGYSGCYEDYVFPKPQYICGAPQIVARPSDIPDEMFRQYRSELTPEAMEKLDEYNVKMTLYFEQYEQFIQSLDPPNMEVELLPQTKRTPELLARIERTNELAAKILERAKQPDSTFSQNMVEFIQLRGFLVDMRYAENLEAEKMAFQKLIDFVDESQDKELWIDFLYDVGLGSIGHSDYFHLEKVEDYRTRFAERFQIPKRGLFE